MQVQALPQRPSMMAGDGEVFPENILEITVRLAELADEEKLWAAYIKELSALEAPLAGVFYAAQLHEARQYRMVLRYRKDFCQARLKRLNGFM